MADNYLENQYEQYRARKAAWEKAKKSGKAQTLHKPTLPLKKRRKESFRDRRCRGYWQSHCRSLLQA